MGFFARLFGHEPRLIRLLSARIISGEGMEFYVEFTRHHPELKSPEFIRIVLHYYAKWMFNLTSTQFYPVKRDSDDLMAANILMHYVHESAAVPIAKDSNILSLAGIDDVVRMVDAPPTNTPREFVATLYFVDRMQRHITTDMPETGYNQQAVFSVLALMQAVIREIEKDDLPVLSRALRSMNDAYENGAQYSDTTGLSLVPNAAFMSAVGM
jgi:hypothetical protein